MAIYHSIINRFHINWKFNKATDDIRHGKAILFKATKRKKVLKKGSGCSRSGL
jgi:hypothetical protein